MKPGDWERGRIREIDREMAALEVRGRTARDPEARKALKLEQVAIHRERLMLGKALVTP